MRKLRKNVTYIVKPSQVAFNKPVNREFPSTDFESEYSLGLYTSVQVKSFYEQTSKNNATDSA